MNAATTRVSKTNGEVTGIRDAAVVQQAFENACRVANVCDEYRGHDTVVLDTTQITPLFDYFVITTGKSRRQLRAIADHSDDALAELGSERRSTSGYQTEWICHDYGDVVLHVFSPDARQQLIWRTSGLMHHELTGKSQLLKPDTHLKCACN